MGRERDHPDRHNQPDLKQNAPEIRGVSFLSKADAMA